jgi:hypothetical protein
MTDPTSKPGPRTGRIAAFCRAVLDNLADPYGEATAANRTTAFTRWCATLDQTETDITVADIAVEARQTLGEDPR